VFWAPEILPAVIPVRPALPFSADTRVSLKLSELTAGELRQAPDGWHAVLYLRGVEHRVWVKESPVIAEAYAVELQLDRDFEFRAHAARRLASSSTGGPIPPRPCPGHGSWKGHSGAAVCAGSWTASKDGRTAPSHPGHRVAQSRGRPARLRSLAGRRNGAAAPLDDDGGPRGQPAQTFATQSLNSWPSTFAQRARISPVLHG
jgi:hypothetical protein